MIITASFLSGAAQAASKTFVYFGTYTGEKSKGIYVATLDDAGKLGAPVLAGEANRPSWVALAPSGKFLYSVDETDKFEGKPGGAVTAFSVDQTTGKLTKLNQQTSGGGGPCHLTVDATGKVLLAANYGGGSIQSIAIEADGKLGKPVTFFQHTGSSVDPKRQKEPHAHGIYLDGINKFVFVPDLGLDKIMCYRLDPKTGILLPNFSPYISVGGGSGPRHFAFHPSYKYAYCINEMSCTVNAFTYKAQSGELADLQTGISTLPPNESVKPGYSTAELIMHPNSSFLYGSNRGHNTIVLYSVGGDGRVTHVENVSSGGKTPRGFGIDPSGRFLIAGNQDSDSVVVFNIDSNSGKLTPTGQSIEVGKPVCVQFLVTK